MTRSFHRSAVLVLLLASATAASAQTPCVGGAAGGYPCDGVDLMARLPLSTFATTGSAAPAAGNDIWGWTDPTTGREYALVGLTNGTAFVDVTVPAAPVFLGKLPGVGAASSWRDIKVYANHAFIVSESSGHGMQVFDLTRLRSVASPPVTFAADARYTGVGKAHNIVIDESIGRAYLVGANQSGFTCNAGGLHMVSLTTPTSPTFAGCYDADGYTHDAQCLVYDGPDADYTGRSVCFALNEDTVTIVDVTSAAAPVQIARVSYPTPSYTHQGWLTEDRRHLLVNDEVDGDNLTPTRTLVMDVADLDDAGFAFAYGGTSNARDHNLYVIGAYAYESNYAAGLRILDLSGIDGGTFTEVAFFDTYPANDNFNFSGQWSNYPYFASGIVVANDIQGGLFVLSPSFGPPPVASVSPSSVAATLAPEATTSRTVTLANTASAGSADLSFSAAVVYDAPLTDAPAGAPAAASPARAAEAPPSPQGLKGDDARAGTGSAAFGAGGPDAFGYTWKDSNEPGGPAVAFQNIAATGTAITTWTATGTFPAADEGYADVSLPFSFSAYGSAYGSVRVSTNGFLAFVPFSANTFTTAAMPSSGLPNGLVAPFWDDFDLSQAAGGTVYTGTLPDGRFVVQFNAVKRYNQPTHIETFQVLLRADGTVEYQYGALSGTLNAATVGIENAAGTDGLQVVRNAAYLASNKAVRFTPPGPPPPTFTWLTVAPASGSVAPGASTPLALTLDAAGLDEGVYTATLRLTTNDPANATLDVPVTLTVSATLPPTYTVTAPAAGDLLAAGTKVTVRYTGPGVPDATQAVDVYLRAPGGALTLVGSGVNSGKRKVTLPAGTAAGSGYAFRVVRSDDASVYGESAAVGVTNAAERYALAQPTAGVSWARGATHVVTWAAPPTAPAGTVRLEFVRDNGVTVTTFAGEPDDGSFAFAVPASQAVGDYFFRITSEADAAFGGTSAAFNVSRFEVTAPGVGATWAAGSAQTVTWTAGGSASGATVKISLKKVDGGFSQSLANGVAYGLYTRGVTVPAAAPGGTYVVQLVYTQTPPGGGAATTYTVNSAEFGVTNPLTAPVASSHFGQPVAGSDARETLLVVRGLADGAEVGVYVRVGGDGGEYLLATGTVEAGEALVAVPSEIAVGEDEFYFGATAALSLRVFDAGRESTVEAQAVTLGSDGSALEAVRMAAGDVVVVDAAKGGAVGGGASSVFAVQGVSPNPASSSATVRFTAPSSVPATVVVYDLLGRAVATAFSGEAVAGLNEVSVATQALPAGVYVVRVTAGSESAAARFTVVR